MDSIFAIGLGLALRVIVSSVTDTFAEVDDDESTGGGLKIATSLIGLWEGIVLHHFLQKWPKSFDPYIAYAVRLFVDLLFTESLSRMALVLIWTCLGVVLADFSPAIYRESGLKRTWYRVRRDLSYGIPIPKAALPTRVRFREIPPASASQRGGAGYAASSVSTATSIAPSDVTASYTTRHTARSAPPIPVPAPRRLTSRIVPGSFPDDISEASGTERGSIRTVDLPPLPPSHSGTSVVSEDTLSYVDEPLAPRPLSRDMTEIPDLTPTTPTPGIGTQSDDDELLTPRRRSIPYPADLQPQPSTGETQPPLADIPNINDDWQNIDKGDFDPDDIRIEDGRTSTPPLYTDPYHHAAPTNDGDMVNADLLAPYPRDDKKRLSVDPQVHNNQGEPNRDSILSSASHQRLTAALELRKELAQLRKRKDAAEFERQQAMRNNKRMLGMTKKQEREKLEKQIRTMEERISKRVFDVHNRALPSSLVNISDLPPQLAIERVEQAIECLLQPPPPQAPDDASALLSWTPTNNIGEYVTGPKTLTVKVNETITGEERDVLEEVKYVMDDYGFTTSIDPHDLNTLTIHLPKAE